MGHILSRTLSPCLSIFQDIIFFLKYGHVWDKTFLVCCPSLEFSITQIAILPTPAITAYKAEKHIKEGQINATIGKSWYFILTYQPHFPAHAGVFPVLQIH